MITDYRDYGRGENITISHNWIFDKKSGAKPKKEDIHAGRIRRRTEDILEASRLERDVLYEVWELS